MSTKIKIEQLPLKASFLFYLVSLLVVIALIWMYFMPVEELVTTRGYVNYTGQAEALSAPVEGVVRRVGVESSSSIIEGDELLVIGGIKERLTVDEEIAILSPAEGIIVWHRQLIRGDIVQFGERLAIIYPKSPVGVVAYLTDRDLGRVKPDMPVRITFDAYPHQNYGTIEGRVDRISTHDIIVPGQERQLAAVIDIKEIDDDRIRLLPGLAATVEIIIGRTSMLRMLL